MLRVLRSIATSRRAVEILFLFLLGIGLSWQCISKLPNSLHPFEFWVDPWIPVLTKGWREIHQAFFYRFGDNDTNASVLAPVWVSIIALSQMIFQDPLLAHRIPSALSSVLVAVLFSEIVRRFYRPDLALLAGLLCVSSQNLLFFGVMGGYLVPTVTLFTLIMLCALTISIEQKRLAWLSLCVCLLITPFMYATIRYMVFLPLAIIAYKFIRSQSFRGTHAVPLACVVAVLIISLYMFMHDGIYANFIMFFNARGEQYLFTDSVIRGGRVGQPLSLVERFSAVLIERPQVTVRDLIEGFKSGSRFFSWTYQSYAHNMHLYLTGFMLLGLVRCVFLAFSMPRYLVLVGWSVWTWVPLLFTTSMSRNRMLIGLPVDLFLALMGFALPFDALSKVVPPKSRWLVRFVMSLGVLHVCYFSVYCLLQDIPAHSGW